jgi:hypothetical protein
MNYPPGQEIRKFKFIAAQVNKVTYMDIIASDELTAYERVREAVEGGTEEDNWQDPPEDLKTVYFQYEDEIDLGELLKGD